MSAYGVKVLLLIIVLGTLLGFGIGQCTKAHAQEQAVLQTTMEAYVVIEAIPHEKGTLSVQIFYSLPPELAKDVTAFQFIYFNQAEDDEDTAVYVTLTPDGKIYPDGQLRTKKAIIEPLESNITYKYIVIVNYKGTFFAAKSSKKNTFTMKGQ